MEKMISVVFMFLLVVGIFTVPAAIIMEVVTLTVLDIVEEVLGADTARVRYSLRKIDVFHISALLSFSLIFVSTVAMIAIHFLSIIIVILITVLHVFLLLIAVILVFCVTAVLVFAIQDKLEQIKRAKQIKLEREKAKAIEQEKIATAETISICEHSTMKEIIVSIFEGAIQDRRKLNELERDMLQDLIIVQKAQDSPKVIEELKTLDSYLKCETISKVDLLCSRLSLTMLLSC